MRVRRAAVEGSFYPRDPAKLRAAVRRYLDGAAIAWQGPVRALIVPHAGFIYSGWVAAQAYALLRGQRCPTVILVGPTHHHTTHAGFSLWAEGAFATPLGEVPIDAEMMGALLARGSDFADRTEAHRDEHCLEVQIPFLQEVLGEFRIVPILQRDQRLERCRQLAEALAAVATSETLLIASTDLSHYHSKQAADRLDSVVEKRIGEFDPEALYSAIEAGEAEMCGGGPAISVMLAARALGCTRASVLKRADSSDSPEGHGGAAEVVGYIAAALA